MWGHDQRLRCRSESQDTAAALGVGLVAAILPESSPADGPVPKRRLAQTPAHYREREGAPAMSVGSSVKIATSSGGMQIVSATSWLLVRDSGLRFPRLPN